MTSLQKNNPRVSGKYSAGFTQHYYGKQSSVFGRSGAVAVSKLEIAFSKNSAGFSLIEVMVVIAIIGVMTAVVTVSFGTSRVERELATNAREFAAVVREAQTYALTGRQLVSNTDKPCRFVVRWNDSSGPSSPTSYILRYWESSSGVCSVASTTIFTLKNGVTFSGSYDLIYFTLPSGKIIGKSGALESATPNFVTVTFTKQFKSHSVCIYAHGRIEDRPGSGVC